MNKPTKVLWILFILFALTVLGGTVGSLENHAFDLFIIYTPLVLLIYHSCLTLSFKRGLLFILIAGFLGFVAEAVSLNYGTLFGGQYTYQSGSAILNVPISIIVYWSVFIYVGYSLTNNFALWLGRFKPTKTRGDLKNLGLLVLADGLTVTAIDLFMDPIKVRDGAWAWLNGGPYFGVPVGNFIGWFIVTIIATGTFRLYEYYLPNNQIKFNSLILLPVFAYLLIGINFLISAIGYRLFWLAFIGTIIVILPALLNLSLFINKDRLS